MSGTYHLTFRPRLACGGLDLYNEVLMELAANVQKFSDSCESLLSSITMHRPLTDEEVRVIEYYCIELLAKIASRDPRP